MNYKVSIIMVALIGFSISLAGCSGNPVKINKAVDPQSFDFKRGGPIKANACGFQFLSIFPIAINGRQERAVEELHEKGDFYFGDVQIQERWTWALLGTVHCTNIKATAYPRKRI